MRVLPQALINVLPIATRRSTLKIILGDDTELYFSTGTYSHGGVNWVGKLAPVDALNLETTAATEGVEIRISNVTLTLGQDLINNKDKLDGAYAMLGCYFRDASGEWHDEKIPGILETGDIDANWIPVFFKSIAEKRYYGPTIADLFPEEQIPAAEMPEPVITGRLDGFRGRGDYLINRKFVDYREFDPDFGDFGGRNFLPRFEPDFDFGEVNF